MENASTVISATFRRSQISLVLDEWQWTFFLTVLIAFLVGTPRKLLKVSLYSQSRPPTVHTETTQNEMLNQIHFFQGKVASFFLFLEVSVMRFYQRNCFVQNTYTAEINICNVDECTCEPTRKRVILPVLCVHWYAGWKPEWSYRKYLPFSTWL